MRRVLVPIDGSEGSMKAVRFAAELVRDAGGELLLLHVYDAPAPSAVRVSSEAAAQLDDSGTRAAQASFERAKTEMAGIEPVANLVEIGAPAEAIVAVAAKQAATQIVMGTRGLSPVKELLLGAVSERVARSAPCPVTLVR